jgi:NADH:ubiquinone oxidoreductase subunit 2 (subunit N)
MPVVPLYTWLPDAHVEAPTPVSVTLAGVFLKMGTYTLLWFNFTMLPVNSAISVFCYSRVVRAVWTEPPADDLDIEEYPAGLYAAIALALPFTVLLAPGFGFVLEFAETGADIVTG